MSNRGINHRSSAALVCFCPFPEGKETYHIGLSSTIIIYIMKTFEQSTGSLTNYDR
jgi:hypothetical protein